jgi:hypothetical protein
VWVRDCTQASDSYPIQSAAADRFEGRVEEISSSEIHLLVNRQVDKGSLLSVELAGGADQGVEQVLTYVLRAWPRGEQWALTCVFSRELSEEDLGSFEACRSKPLPPTRRAWSRFPCGRPVAYHLLNSSDQKRLPAETVDISATGIGLIVSEPVDTGAVLSLEIKGRPGRPERIMLACVVRSGSVGEGRWRLGCNFIRQLEDSELEGFI